MEAASRPLALVTGASAGIGWAYAEWLAAEGYDLVVVGRRTERLEVLKRELESAHGVAVRPLPADLATDDGMRATEAAAVDPHIELIVDNAALARYMPFLDLPVEQAEELLRLNALAPMRLMHAALPGMVERGRGAFVSVASLLAFSGAADNPQMPRRVVYASTKAFLFTMIRLLALELRDTGVRLQVVCPGVVRTEFHTRQGMDMSDRPRMEPEDVVLASMAALERGELICVPGLEDAGVLERHQRAELDVLQGGLRASLAQRYRE